MLTYNQNGTSRGIASIIFAKADTAAKAAKELNGLLVDGRPMKIEVVYDASHAPAVPAPKPLNERIAQKSQPKPATAAKAAKGKGKNAAVDKNATGRNANGRQRKGRNPGRGKPKSVEELDAEMVDYFSNENAPAQATAPANSAAPQPTNNGEDLGMAEIS
jgi:THO complex subunit 4